MAYFRVFLVAILGVICLKFIILLTSELKPLVSCNGH
jgi:hypothetical protein